MALSLDKARRLASTRFPYGPEAIAEVLGVGVEYCDRLTTCLGWCVRNGDRVKIRINTNVIRGRQRFTLAHELAHVLLGTPPEPLALGSSLFSSTRTDERDADQLAAEMLLPLDRLKQLIGTPPLDQKSIQAIAAKAVLTPDMVAGRIANLAQILGLLSAGVLRFTPEGKLKSFYSASIGLAHAGEPERLLAEYRASGQKFWRKPRPNGTVITMFSVGDPSFPKLFVQVLPAEVGHGATRTERIRTLRQNLFKQDVSAASSFGACVGPFRDKVIPTLGPVDPIDAFLAKYKRKAWCARLGSAEGRELLRLYFTTAG